MHGDKRVIVEQLVLDEELFATNRNKPLIGSVIPSGVEGSHRIEKEISPLRSASVEMTKEQTITINPCIKTLIVKPE